MMKTFTYVFVIAALILSQTALYAYEINNHADISTEAVNLSALTRSANAKLARLGLRQLDTSDTKQRFPLPDELGLIPYCFGSERPEPFKVTTTTIPPQQAGNTVLQPNWAEAALSSAQRSFDGTWRVEGM